MNKCIKIICLVFIISLIFNTHYSCFASNKDAEIDTSIMNDSFIKDLNPNGVSGAAEKISTPFVKIIHEVVSSVLGFVQLIGGILMVVSIAMFGLGLLLSGNQGLAGELGLRSGDPEARVELLNFGRRLLIGSVLLFSSSTLVKFVFNIFDVAS